MIPVIVILVYLCVIGYIGSAAFRRSKANTEDFFLAGRSVGTMVFFLSLFATNMTSVAILGSSGMAYRTGIGVYGLMASSSGLIIPLTIFLIGTRLWALGKRFGHMTQVQLFRDRWECSGIGTFIFALTAAMLLPYLIVSMAGGGHVLETISTTKGGSPLIPFWLGCLIVAVVVTANVFFGGMRGVVWVNVFQTILFVTFGTIALLTINANLPGGVGGELAKLAGTPQGALLARDRIPPETFFSYMFIPFSSIMFPHMAIMCLSAKRLSAFKNTVIAYPVAIMFTWLPCVFLGVVGAAAIVPPLVGTQSDAVLLHLLGQYAPVWLAGILGAGIISAVMGSDCHQVLALSTMFTKDIFSYYGGKEKYGEKGAVHFARAFVIIASAIAYVIALKTTTNIFDLAVKFAFSGFAAMAPVMIAALFWKRSTKWGALASSVWVAICVFMIGYLTNVSEAIAPKPPTRPAAARGARAPGAGAPGARLAAGPAGASVGGPGAANPAAGPQVPRGRAAAGRRPAGRPAGPRAVPIFPSLGNVFMRDAVNVTVFGYLPVVPMIFGSALLMVLVSLVTRPPSKETIEKYFPAKGDEAVVGVREEAAAV